jgi:Phage-related protein
MGDSLERLKDFPDAARANAGFQIRRVQDGDLPVDWRSMPDIGKGVQEIRIHRPNEYRVLYVARFKGAIYVLHAFEKKTQKTPKRDIDLAKTRYAALLKQITKEQ